MGLRAHLERVTTQAGSDKGLGLKCTSATQTIPPRFRPSHGPLVKQRLFSQCNKHPQDKRKYHRVELCSAVQWERFRDGWPDIFINNVQEIAGRDGRCVVNVFM